MGWDTLFYFVAGLCFVLVIIFPARIQPYALRIIAGGLLSWMIATIVSGGINLNT